ncbi:hypothetical protein GOODEAATRI_015260 [Goodea atripinnis]|uniref:Uncharacterized protein n=1 Tax=Goodea atripinnis TaxID=208336 RepID=A0ABV0P4L0_9TELE
MDSVPDTEVFESQEQITYRSFSTFGKETPVSQQHFFHPINHYHLLQNHRLSPHQGSLKREELKAFLPSPRAPYYAAYLSKYSICSGLKSSDFDLAVKETEFSADGLKFVSDLTHVL